MTLLGRRLLDSSDEVVYGLSEGIIGLLELGLSQDLEASGHI